MLQLQPQMLLFRTIFNRQSDPLGAAKFATHFIRKLGLRSSTSDSK